MASRGSANASFAPLSCAPNFRDVADHVPALRPHVLYRSDLIFDPDPADERAITACGIRLVVDLRGPTERARLPNRWFMDAGVEVLMFDVAAGADPGRIAAALELSAGAAGARALMLEAYRSFPAGALVALDVIGARIAAGDLPMVIHCAAGKDRTGFVIAALLTAIGADAGVVTNDYVASAGRAHARTRDHVRAMMATMGGKPDEHALAGIGDVHPDYLGAARAEAAAVHGSFETYLRNAGLTGERLQRIKRRLLA